MADPEDRDFDPAFDTDPFAADDDAPSEAPEPSIDPLADILGDAGEVVPEPEVPEPADVPELPPEAPERPVGLEPLPDDPLATAVPETTGGGPQPGMSLAERTAAAGGAQQPRAAPGFAGRGEGFAQPTPPEQPFDSADVEDEESFDPDDPFRGDDQPSPAAQPPGEPPPQAAAPGAVPSEMGGDDGLADAVAEGNKSMAELLVTADLLVGMIPDIKTTLEEIREAIKKINTGVT